MIQFEAQITEKEYTKLNLNIIYRKPVIIIVMVGITVGVINLFVSADFTNQSSSLEYLPIVLLVYFIGILPFSIRRMSKKYYKAQAGLHEKVLYTVSEAGIHAKGQTFENTTNWNTLKSLTVGKTWILMIREGIVGIYIPLNAITNTNNLNAIVAMAKNAGVKIKGNIPA